MLLEALAVLLVLGLHRVEPPADAVLVVQGALDALQQAGVLGDVQALLVDGLGLRAEPVLQRPHGLAQVAQHEAGLLGAAAVALGEPRELPLDALAELVRAVGLVHRALVPDRQVLLRVLELHQAPGVHLHALLGLDHAALQALDAGAELPEAALELLDGRHAVLVALVGLGQSLLGGVQVALHLAPGLGLLLHFDPHPVHPAGHAAVAIAQGEKLVVHPLEGRGVLVDLRVSDSLVLGHVRQLLFQLA
mmetsp:Transcript_96307/g.272299  ORF Transcript_96307/g.272299 Transcript_96307/m.272299 type:complete len:249 (+) Transcript_96307:718-1464(+)